jgi:hypothetical protein
MAKIERVTQYWVRIPKRLGSLANILDTIASGGVNGRAFVAWEEKTKGVLLFVGSDGAKATRALKKAKPKVRVTKEPALAVTAKNRRGSAKRMAQALADAGINITGCHASCVGTGNYLTIITTDNNAKAAKVLKGL